MSEPGTPPADGFVSFKTIPDEEKARSLAERLKDEGFKVTFIHGDSACPHPFGSKEANRWIQQLLSTQHYRGPCSALRPRIRCVATGFSRNSMKGHKSAR